MAKSAGYYNVDDFNAYKRTQSRCVPPRINVLTAAIYIQILFDTKKLTYGFMGGLPMLCLEYKREMADLHIAYEGKDFDRLQAKLGSDRRIRLPIGMNPLLPFKILVWTGPSHKDHGCTVDATIELDLVPSGSYGSPAVGALAQNLTLLGLQTTGGKQMTFRCLNVKYQMATLLAYCKARDLLWDPRKDILYLCKYETEQVHRARGQLNGREVKELFLGTPFFSRINMGDQRLCYRTLLDTDPPPTMSVTPPAPQDSAHPQQRQDVLERNTDARSLRVRYRKASDQRNSSSDTAFPQAMNHLRSQSAEHLQDPGPLSRIEGVQYVKSAKPQTVSVRAAAKHARNSMPNMKSIQHTSQTRDIRKTTPHQKTHGMSQCDDAHHQSYSHGGRSAQTSSKLDFGADYQPAYMKSKVAIENANQNDNETCTKRTDSNSTSSKGTSVRGIQSQRGSLHAVSPEWKQAPLQQYFEDGSAPLSQHLHLVGPEGAYNATRKPQETKEVLQDELQKSYPAPPLQKQPALVFELEATAPAISKFVAELPSDTLPVKHLKCRGDTTTHHQTSSRPFAGRTSSVPSEHGTLPASLVAGRPGLRVYHQSCETAPSGEPAVTFSTRQTNAYRYSSFVSPSSVVPTNPGGGPPGPAYKAYQPFVITDELSRTDSVSSVYSPKHRRDASDDSTASHDSVKLAKEYQELLGFEKGYWSS